MPVENRVDIEFTEQDITDINQAITTLNQKLDPLLIALSGRERQSLPKMSDKTIAFVNKVNEYVDNHPEFAPPYMDKEAMKHDLAAVNNLNNIYRNLEQVVSNLDDTIMTAGSEAYVASLSYYNSVKMAARLDIPDAKTILEDLKQRFPQRPKK